MTFGVSNCNFKLGVEAFLNKRNRNLGKLLNPGKGKIAFKNPGKDFMHPYLHVQNFRNLW